MIVNESGLLSAMKDSYKLGGYHVAVGEVFDKKCYLITSGGYSWAAVICHSKMPRKILGLLAEHIGRLPEEGEAFLCKQKTEAQSEMLDVTINPILQKLVAAGETYNAIKRTRLTWDGDNVWQDVELNVALIRPDLEKIINFKDTSPRLVEHCLYVDGQLSYVYIHRTVPGEAEKNIVAQLGRAIWT